MMVDQNGVYVVSVRLLVNAAQQRAHLRNSGQEMTSYQIIMKIALLTGLPNILAFSIVFIDKDSNWKDVMNILYSVIYGLQGAFLTITFLSSKNIKSIVAKQFFK